MYSVLDKVNNINDLKKLNTKELPDLCTDIRSFLVDKVSKTGGHLAPNLGVVELTVALHYVFNSPKDKVIFDVGHQCYVHKILTGRKNKFNTLRKLNGLSGFPKTRESLHDIFNTGHSSTSISSAIGVAVANKLDKKDDYTIAVIGDGALTGGLAFEGLNNADIRDTNLIVILNDNQMSISPSVGGLSNYLNKIRSNKIYTGSKRKVKSLLSRIPVIGKWISLGLEWTKRSFKHIFLPSSILFEQFGFTYLGPVDGHNIDDLLEFLERAKALKKPVLVHVITKKGKGYTPAEENPNAFHGISPFDKITGKPLKNNKASYSEVFGETICSLARQNEKIVSITAAMPSGTNLNEFAKKYPDRFFDVGIAESHAVTFASGLARQGYIPVFAVYSTFLQRAYDQILHDVALQNLHVIFAIDRAGIVGADGETHHGLFDLSFLSHIPNMTILSPKDGIELQQMLKFATQHNGPIAIRYPRDGYIMSLADTHPIELGKAEIILEGSDISIISTGKSLRTAMEIAEELKKVNVSSDVINARFIKPFDEETIIKSVTKTRRVITIEDNIINGGLASAVQKTIINLNGVQSMYFAYPDEFIVHGTSEEIEKLYGLDSKSILEKIAKMF
ncbi:MAG: 1-deoxy-D-xylulose-5-phosphate synthase [Clostridia bacterium]|nr:1-deoxy-D-xylulose-5-phosphate synthase [Clostridia bacterium]